MKKLLLLSVLVAGLAPFTAQAACATGQIRNEARARTRTPGIAFAMSEVQTFTRCADGTQAINAVSARFTVSVGGEIVCTRTDVDPSFDPFGFGAGLHLSPADEGPCAVGVTWSSLEPNGPLADESGAVDDGAALAIGKRVLAEHDTGEDQLHGLRLGSTLHEIADPDGLVFRKLVVLPA